MKRLIPVILLSLLSGAALARPCDPVAAGSFETYLAAIQRSTTTLIANTSSPLNWVVIGNADEQPPQKSAIKSREIGSRIHATWPATNSELKIRSFSAKKTKALVIVAKPDTDYQFEFRFHRIAGCWLLTEVEDQSL